MGLEEMHKLFYWIQMLQKTGFLEMGHWLIARTVLTMTIIMVMMMTLHVSLQRDF